MNALIQGIKRIGKLFQPRQPAPKADTDIDQAKRRLEQIEQDPDLPLKTKLLYARVIRAGLSAKQKAIHRHTRRWE